VNAALVTRLEGEMRSGGEGRHSAFPFSSCDTEVTTASEVRRESFMSNSWRQLWETEGAFLHLYYGETLHWLEKKEKKENRMKTIDSRSRMQLQNMRHFTQQWQVRGKGGEGGGGEEGGGSLDRLCTWPPPQECQVASERVQRGSVTSARKQEVDRRKETK